MRSATIVVLGLALAGCGGKTKPGATPTTIGGGGEPDPQGVIAQTLVGWGRQQAQGGALNLFLEVTDHTGMSKSFPLGGSTTPCNVGRGNGTDIITTLVCVVDGSGVELRAVFRASQLIVLRRPVDPSDDPADLELSFREVTRVAVPAGSKVGAAE